MCNVSLESDACASGLSLLVRGVDAKGDCGSFAKSAWWRYSAAMNSGEFYLEQAGLAV